MKRLLSFAVIAGAGYCAWRYFQRSARPVARIPVRPGDELVTQRVQVSLRQAGVVPQQLQVRVHDGLVRLSGTVSAADRDRILRATLAAPGVRGVNNQLTVAVESQPWEPSPNAP